MGVITEKEYEIRYFQVDYKKRLLLTDLINFFTDIAVFQGDLIKVDLDYLKENNLAWVLYKWDIKIDRMPGYGEKIKIITKAESFRAFYAMRSFQVKDEKDQLIITADSIWFLIDTKLRSPKRIPAEFLDYYSIKKEDKYKPDIPKIEAFEGNNNIKTFNIRYSDIDTNMHVNNGKYVSYMIESIPKDIVTKYNLNRLIVTYEKETKYGESISSMCQVREEGDQLILLHKTINEDGRVLTVGQSYFSI